MERIISHIRSLILPSVWPITGREFRNVVSFGIRFERLDQVLVGCGFFYDRGAMMEATLQAIGDLFRQHIHGIRRFGTASLDLCQVAMGRFGGFFEYELAPWDFAAGAMILTEAGGAITTCRGEALPLSKTGVLASNGTLHLSLQSIVSQYCLD